MVFEIADLAYVLVAGPSMYLVGSEPIVRMVVTICCSAALFAMASSSAWSGADPNDKAGRAWKALPHAGVAKIQSDSFYVSTAKNPIGGPWKQIQIFQWVDADPIDVAAVQYDVTEIPGYHRAVSNTKVCKVSRGPTREIYYYVKLPPIVRDEWYTLHNEIESYSTAGGAAYQVTWNITRSRLIKLGSRGKMMVEPYWDPQRKIYWGSLIAFTSSNDPGNRVGANLDLVKARGREGLIEQVKTMGRRAEAHKSSPDLVRCALNGLDRSGARCAEWRRKTTSSSTCDEYIEQHAER